MSSFKEIFDGYSWEEASTSIYAKTAKDVEYALTKKTARNLEDFKALISPAAAPYLEQMAQLSQQITLKRFGKTIQLFAPMYLSNECNNICTYCGFSFENKVRRRSQLKKSLHPLWLASISSKQYQKNEYDFFLYLFIHY